MNTTESVQSPDQKSLKEESKVEKPLTQEEIDTIAELVWEEHGRNAMMSNKAVPLVSAVMKEAGCTQKQIDTQRIEVSRAILKIRSDS